jgi:hypothetical protein
MKAIIAKKLRREETNENNHLKKLKREEMNLNNHLKS